jgi:hypothetical protein
MNGGKFNNKVASIRRLVSELTLFLSDSKNLGQYQGIRKSLDKYLHGENLYGNKARCLMEIFSFFLTAMDLTAEEAERLKVLSENKDEEVVPGLRQKIAEALRIAQISELA